jgi:hypothetical protein
VYNTSLVQQLCGEIVAEKDAERTEQLLGLLQAVLREDTEEIRTRMAFLAKTYSDVISESKAAVALIRRCTVVWFFCAGKGTHHSAIFGRMEIAGSAVFVEDTLCVIFVGSSTGG